MKKVLLAAAILTSFMANAKLTLFSTQDAAKLALENDVLSKVFAKTKTNTFSKVSVEKIEANKFEVLVETSQDKKYCETIVNIQDKRKTAILPGGGAITTNLLVVSKINKASCL